jgi:hypothetical protein
LKNGHAINTPNSSLQIRHSNIDIFLFLKGYSLGRMPVFIKHGILNQYILNIHF